MICWYSNVVVDVGVNVGELLQAERGGGLRVKHGPEVSDRDWMNIEDEKFSE